LDTTIGGSASDSYASLDEATAYAQDQGTDAAAAWLAATTKQEGTLRQAARVLDTLTWRGLKVNLLQRLEWPRTWVEDKNGYPVNPLTIPFQVKNAQCELAIRLLAEDRGDEPARLEKSVKVGQIEVEYATGGSPRAATGLVYQLCGQFLQGGIGSAPLVRG
jgi:hypothetical protein